MGNLLNSPIRVSFVSGPAVGQDATFDAKDSPVLIGRRPSSALHLTDDKSVSGRHAQLLWQNGHWHVQDLNSKNGSFIQKGTAYRRIDDIEPLRDGDVVVIGQTVLRLDTLEDDGSDTATQDATPVWAPEAKEQPETTDSARADKLMLRVERDGEELRCQFFSSGAYGSRYSVPYREDDIREINARIREEAHRASVESPGKGNPSERLKEFGTMLRDLVVPRRVQEKLALHKERDLFLLHCASCVSVPWELVVIEDQFLCERFNLGRQVVVDHQSSVLLANRPHTPLRVLIVCDPIGELPEAQSRAERLFEQLLRAAPHWHIDFLAGARVQRLNLLSRLSRTDLLYLVGHAEYDEHDPGQSGWPLKSGWLRCADFRTLQTPPRFVFANGCETTREGEWTDSAGGLTGAFGIASSFVLAGVQGYLGAAWPIPATSSGEFAADFFTELAAGFPIGQSTRRARRHVRENQVSDDAVWASYALYGDPSWTLE
jgi:pSer/pThr/pTyr-binding forkhead associated (FHA) protein